MDVLDSQEDSSKKTEKVYFRKRWRKKDPPQSQTSLVKESQDPYDLNLSIVLRKGKKTSTSLPISNCVFFNKICYLSSVDSNHYFQKFARSLSSVDIPKLLLCALSYESWKKTMLEEINALHKNKSVVGYKRVLLDIKVRFDIRIQL